MCEAKIEALVRYPRTQTPSNGLVTVTAECAENAHTTNSSTLNVSCASTGSWSVETLQCECDKGYTIEVTLNGTQICQG